MVPLNHLRRRPRHFANNCFADNHKPSLSSESAPSQAKIKPSIPGKTSSYDLAFDDNGGKYAFTGARKTDDDQYVLYFDADRKAFILDKVDSTFDMNVTRVPGNSDADDLRKRHPHIKTKAKQPDKSSAGKAAASEKPKPKGLVASKKQPEPRKPEKKASPPAKQESLAMPAPSKSEEPKPKKKKKQEEEEEEEEDEDDDGGLLIEYPGGNNASAKNTDFSPAFPTQRRFDDYMDQQESGADDADAESDEDPDLYKLPSPVSKPVEQQQDHAMPDVQVEEDDDDLAAALEADLQKEMEIAFEDLANSQEDSKAGDESEISEED